jgi:hypothetical protein
MGRSEKRQNLLLKYFVAGSLFLSAGVLLLVFRIFYPKWDYL